MTRREAEVLSRNVEKDDHKCRVTGMRSLNGSFVLDVTDVTTGDSFTVTSPEHWAKRHAWRN